MTTYAELRARLATPPDHDRFRGPPVDAAGLSPDELGRLWPLLQAAWQDEDTAAPVREQARQVMLDARQRGLAPRLDRDAMLATLQAAAPHFTSVDWLLEHAGYLATGPDPVFEAALTPLLPEDWMWRRHAMLAVTRAFGAAGLLEQVADAVIERFGDMLPAREFAVLRGARLSALLALGAGHYYQPRSADAASLPDPAALLADDPDYVAFARRELEAAADLLDRIHAGAVPYQADGAFGSEEGMVLGLAARVAATRDEPWYAQLVGRLLPGACVAPTAARTAPSQSLTVVLGHVVEGVPTPEGVAALREALQVVRHAGLQKKLARNQKPAERGLALRPQIALRLLDPAIAAGFAPKQLRALLAQFFEGGFARPAALPYRAWRERLLGSDAGAPFARTLVWQAGASSFMVDGADRPVDMNGQPLDVAGDAPVVAWHPVEADDAERAAWRDRIAGAKLRQPVRQAFREFYQPASADIFAGYELAALRLGGLARREGWEMDADGLTRRFGDLRATFVLTHPIYPGFEGVVGSRQIVFARGAAAVPLQDVPPRVLSEACRAVDLLVSVAAIAAEHDEDDDPFPRGDRLWLLANRTGVDAMRRHAIERVLATQIADGRLAVEGLHVRVGEARVSIRTGRVLKNGAPVELAVEEPAPARRLRAVPWLPYDEALLERVLLHVGALLET